MHLLFHELSRYSAVMTNTREDERWYFKMSSPQFVYICCCQQYQIFKSAIYFLKLVTCVTNFCYIWSSCYSCCLRVKFVACVLQLLPACYICCLRVTFFASKKKVKCFYICCRFGTFVSTVTFDWTVTFVAVTHVASYLDQWYVYEFSTFYNSKLHL